MEIKDIKEAIKVEIHKLENDETYEISTEADDAQAEILNAIELMPQYTKEIEGRTWNYCYGGESANSEKPTAIEIWQYHLDVVIPKMEKLIN